jgi:t-SNARE complex subunit (syntaxin)
MYFYCLFQQQIKYFLAIITLKYRQEREEQQSRIFKIRKPEALHKGMVQIIRLFSYMPTSAFNYTI